LQKEGRDYTDADLQVQSKSWSCNVRSFWRPMAAYESAPANRQSVNLLVLRARIRFRTLARHQILRPVQARGERDQQAAIELKAADRDLYIIESAVSPGAQCDSTKSSWPGSSPSSTRPQ
jgi:hypothetical protein